jgi:hypothetical protein
MPELIDIALTPEEVASIETMLASLEDTMPFLVGLSPERVKALFKLGPQSEAFVQKTLEAAEQHARLLPASTPVAAMRRDAELRETLRPIRTRVARLLELLDGTMILAGADLMKSASAVYRTLRIHAKGEGIEGTLEDLGKRFAKRRKRERDSDEPIREEEESSGTDSQTPAAVADGREPNRSPHAKKAEASDDSRFVRRTAATSLDPLPLPGRMHGALEPGARAARLISARPSGAGEPEDPERVGSSGSHKAPTLRY